MTPEAFFNMARRNVWSMACIALCAVVCANAYAYVMATTVPLPEADAWRFLGGFLGRYIEGHMSLLDFFSQDKQGETNQPFYKLILLFHTHFFDMDFSIEGLFGLASAVLLLVTLVMLALSDGARRFGPGEAALAIALALVLLSLDSPIVFAWGLASLWFMPILLMVLYLGYATGPGSNRFGLLVASAVLGILLDEVALIGFVATVGSLLLVGRRLRQRSIMEAVCYAAAGIVLSRVFYWLCGLLAGPATPDASEAPWGSLFAKLMSPDCWKAVVVPLSDSLVQPANLKLLLGGVAPAAGLFIALVLLVAHAWFWWRIASDRASMESAPRLTALAIGIQLMFYGLVAGIVLQRVPEHGYAYMHQPRYAIFYQLNLVALILLAYRQCRFLPARAWASRALIALSLLAMAGLQVELSRFGWGYSRASWPRVQAAAFQMGELALHPDRDLQCAPFLTICKYPPGERRRLMGLLQTQQYNLFSQRFQRAHRLYPDEASIPRR